MAKKIQLLRGQETKLKSTTNPSGYALSDAEFFVDTTQHKVFVGDANVTLDGRFALANESDVTAMQTEVENVVQDVADIQTDYAKTASGNTITANSVAIGNAEGKLTGVTGTAGQFIGFDVNGVPIAQSVSAAGALNKSATVTLPEWNGMTNDTSPGAPSFEVTNDGNIRVTLHISGMVENADPFFVIPQWSSSNIDNEKNLWNQIISVESHEGILVFLIKGLPPIGPDVTFKVFWTA